jgi:hypothetical protein
MNQILRLLVCSLLLVCTCRAQEVLSPPPTAAPSAAATQSFGANDVGTIPVPDASLGIAPLPTPFQWGDLEARPHLLYRFLYGDGIPAKPGDDRKTAIHEISPGVLMSFGSHWTVDYTPTWYSYSSSKFNDHLDHALHLSFGSAYRDWVIRLNHNYSATSTPLVETGRQTDQESHNTTLDAYYAFNSKWSFQAEIAQNLRFTPEFNDVHEWMMVDTLAYQCAPRLQLNASFGTTYDNVESGPDMLSENLSVGLSSRIADKATFDVHVGVEDRQILHTAAPDLINPTFGAAFTYQPFEFTTLKLSADRTVSPSFFNLLVAERIDFKSSLRQRLFGRLFFTVTGDYSTVDYVATVFNLPVFRHDDYYSVNFRLTTAVLKRGSISVFYTLADNTSDIALFDFNSNQGGVELGYAY